MFIDPANANLHLKSTATAAIDKVAVLAEAPTDIDGHMRPQGARSDIGADEYGSAPPNDTTPPVPVR
jgi:hypothetical protein